MGRRRGSVRLSGEVRSFRVLSVSDLWSLARHECEVESSCRKSGPRRHRLSCGNCPDRRLRSPGMGVLHDYFRAPDAATAIAWAVGSEAGLDDYGADWFDAKGLDVHIVVGQLVSFAEGVPFKIRRGEGPRLVWPDQEAWPYGEVRPGEESPWESGLLLEMVPETWVATLASVSDDHLPMLAAQWMEIPEVAFDDFADAKGAVEQFRTLARRTQGQGHSVFVRTII